MKRSYGGVPVEMTHHWGRPPLSCLPCRQKKRRCDRNQPCSNCAQRNIPCEYPDHSHDNERQRDIVPLDLDLAGSNHTAVESALESEPPGTRNVDVLDRIRRLEDAVFSLSGREPEPEGILAEENTVGSPPLRFTPFSSHSHTASTRTVSTDKASLYLPPIREARALFNHFVAIMQPTIGILHIPSTRDLMEQEYQSMFVGETPDMVTLMLLLGVFACSALSSTTTLLQALTATQAQATEAYKTYLRVSLEILEDLKPIPASTTALVAMGILAYLVSNASGNSMSGHLMRARCYYVARSMDIHRLDTPKRCEERRVNGCDVVEVEVQRRVWWSLVASDWLSAFSGGVQEGTYMCQPKHMCVDYPTNMDDQDIGSTWDFQPSSEPTPAGFLIYRAQLATISREVVDSMPSISLGDREPCYDTILALDARFQDFLTNLPVFYRLDPESMQQSQRTRTERPYVEWQRTAAHISIHTRLCRLHGPYHIKAMTDPKYAYSRQVCVRSAQTVLDVHKSMDESHVPVGARMARFWVVAQHLTLAALTLATDVSLDATAPDAEARKAKVLAAYETLQRSTEEPCEFRVVVQRNLRTLMSTLNKRRRLEGNAAFDQPRNVLNGSLDTSGSGRLDDLAQVDAHEQDLTGGSAPWDENWDQLWSEFLEVAPDLDFSQWDQLLGGGV